MTNPAQPANNQQTIVIALVVIAVLLAAIVGVLMYNQSKKIPDVNAGATITPPAGTVDMPGSSNGGAPAGGTTDAPFDPKTAPKVPAGTEPEAYVEKYYGLCEKGDYATAYKMLPTSQQLSYKDAKTFEAQLKSYGLKGYEVSKATGSGDEVKIVGTQKAQGMDFPYTWTFVKQGGDWLVKARTMGAQ